MSHYLTPKAVAEMAGCTRQTVNNAINRGELEAVAAHNLDGSVASYMVEQDDAAVWASERGRKDGAG